MVYLGKHQPMTQYILIYISFVFLSVLSCLFLQELIMALTSVFLSPLLNTRLHTYLYIHMCVSS